LNSGGEHEGLAFVRPISVAPFTWKASTDLCFVAMVQTDL